MCVGDRAGEQRDAQEFAGQRDLVAVGVGERFRGMNGIDDGGKGKLAEDSESGAGATERPSRGDVTIESVLNGSVLPEADIVGLIATGEEDDFRLRDEFRDFAVSGIVVALWRCRNESSATWLLEARIVGTTSRWRRDTEFRAGTPGPENKDRLIVSLPDLALLLADHGVAFLAAKRFGEFGHVGERSIDAKT
jgi:hypothetical protein